MQRSTLPIPAIGVMSAILLSTAVAAFLRHGFPDASPPGAPDPKPGTTAGMVVAVDPETGELGMPAPGEIGPARSIGDAVEYARQVAAELVTVTHPDGSQSLLHDGRLADYSVVRMGPDGKPVFLCVHGGHAAREAVGADRPAGEER